MLIDSNEVDRARVEADVCVVGAGAAGISLAREFAGTGVGVCVLESGGVDLEPETQELNAGDALGIEYNLIAARLRFLGGTTGHWGGACWPLEPIDFQKRDWVPHSGWPFGRETLDPYYERAHEVCELGPYNYDPAYWSDPETRPILPIPSESVLPKLYQNSSPPTRFGQAYRGLLEQNDNLRVYLHANAVEIVPNRELGRVDHVRVATLEGRRFEVRARYFVLAGGGIENARILLASRSVQPGGLGNQNDLVGRFFMEHIENECGSIVLPKTIDLAFYGRIPVRGTDVRCGMGLSAATQRRERLLNGWTGFILGYMHYVRQAIERRELPEDLWTNVAKLAGKLEERYLAWRYAEPSEAPLAVEPATSDEPQVDPDAQLIPLRAHAEQAPNPDSRVTLGDDRDPLGLPRVQLDWRLTPLDRRSIRVSTEIVAAEVGRAGLGRVRVDLEEPDDAWVDPERASRAVVGSAHHMGTTRMHDDPKQGVVDADCRVHGLGNLYVAGSSVFPTCGYANPTLTIVALTIRLSDHLKGRLAGTALGRASTGTRTA